MPKLKAILGLIVAIALVTGWYLFRPELMFINKTVNEQLQGMPSTQTTDRLSIPSTLAAGRFHSLAHETQGVATLYRLPDGKLILRLTEFKTSNGPDVRVYLVAAPDSNDDATVTKSGFIDLGRMKGNMGNQNYELPPDTDLSRYRSVSIWCYRFGVNFGAAPLA